VQTGLRTKIGTRGIGKHNSYKWNWSIDALVFVNSSATSWAPTTKSSSVSLRISSYESTKRVYEPFNIHFIGGLADTPLYIYYKEWQTNWMLGFVFGVGSDSQLVWARQVGSGALNSMFSVVIGAYQPTLFLSDLKASCVLLWDCWGTHAHYTKYCI
jgi:hypothetical protein